MSGERRGDTRAPGITRRRFLAGAAVGAVGLAGGGYSGLAFARDDFRPRFDPSEPTGELEDQELDGIIALVQVLVPERFRVGEGRLRRLVEEATTREPGVLREYRDGLALLDGRASVWRDRPFRRLPPEDRRAILDDLLWRYEAEGEQGLASSEAVVPLFLRRFERLWHREAQRRFRQLVVRDLLRRAYTEGIPLVIGYSNLPGVPGDPRDYVEAPQQRPRL